MSEQSIAAVEAELDRLKERVAEMEAALEPFSTFAAHSVEAADDGWVWVTSGRERICDWFGPSDFGLAKHALPAAPLPTKGETNDG